MKPYWTVRGNLTLHDELLLYGGKIVVPKQLQKKQKKTLKKIHTGHQGNLTLHDELLLYGGKIVVPKQLQKKQKKR